MASRRRSGLSAYGTFWAVFTHNEIRPGAELCIAQVLDLVVALRYAAKTYRADQWLDESQSLETSRVHHADRRRGGVAARGAEQQPAMLTELAAKRLKLSREMVPGAKRVAVLVNPTQATNTETTLREVQAGAEAMGLQIRVFSGSTSSEIDSAFAGFEHERPDAFRRQRYVIRRPARAIDAMAPRITAFLRAIRIVHPSRPAG